MITVNWTLTRPTKKGYYWYKDGDSVQIVELKKCPYDKNEICVYYLGYEIGDDILDLDGLWSDKPIERPRI